ncbi:site-specific DNA-methyltransferase [Marimonas lutisalis]|uniref:site-specific DNA-methyltransferase n=1 Tax=Marimonas lutisalis TaxID=2545756 RepID=UPI0010F749A7|nr:DNA methyltransferase [Marimonas lutisalis]
MTQAHIEMIAIGDLKPWSRNARTHSKKQVRQIADSIETFGFTNPVLIDERRTILAGHGRVEGAKLLGMIDVPCLRLDYMGDDEKRAYVLADNKLALNAGWDEDLLAAELGALMSTDLEFDVSVTGFSIPEIDGLLETVAPEEPGDPADDAVPDLAPARVQPGDIWQLGRHRLVCGDALDSNVVAALMDGEEARMVFSDPPYNVPIDGHVGNSGKIQHREFAMAAGEMSRAEFTAFLEAAFRNLADHSTDGSIHFLCMDWRHMSEMLDAGQGIYDEMKNLIVWSKDNGGMGTFYRSRHELIFVFKKGRAPHINNFELGQHGRYRTNVWEYRGVNSRHGNRLEELALHPTVKPVQMIADAIRDVSGRGDIVLDIFGGSGSTLIAAEKTGRRGYLGELDPIYCDRILARWEAFAKDEAEQLLCGWPQQVQV